MTAQWPGTGEGVVHVIMGSVVTASCRWMAPSMWDVHLRRKMVMRLVMEETRWLDFYR
jgi:hypothetical protein